MRIAYGIHGYGQGHATRAWAVLPDLQKWHDVRVFAGGSAYETLQHSFDVQKIPTLAFVYRGARASKWRTITKNLPYVVDLVTLGKVTRQVLADLRSFQPDVVISDCEPYTFRAAGVLTVPRIAFDHFGIMARCRVPMPWTHWLQSLADSSLYKLLVGPAERALVSSFYPAQPRSNNVSVIGPLLRNQVRNVRPTSGSHVLAYFNSGASQLTPPVLAALGNAGVEILLYGAHCSGSLGSIHFRPRGDEAFLRDLASCRAVISTAGNQLVGEAMEYGKPVLAIPESSVEQHMNAAAIARLGVGEWLEPDQLTSDRIRAFLQAAPEYAENARRLARDGKAEALQTLEQWFTELSHRSTYRDRLHEAAA